MHLFHLLGSVWAWAMLVAGSVGCELGELEGEGVLCRNTGFGPGVLALDRTVLLGWSSSRDSSALKVR